MTSWTAPNPRAASAWPSPRLRARTRDEPPGGEYALPSGSRDGVGIVASTPRGRIRGRGRGHPERGRGQRLGAGPPEAPGGAAARGPRPWGARAGGGAGSPPPPRAGAPRFAVLLAQEEEAAHFARSAAARAV